MAATNVQAFSGDVEISSNLAVNTNDLFVDTVSSRVGIGTTNPSDSLHVMGAISTQNGGSPAVTPQVLFRSGPNNTNSWEMKTNVSDSFAGDFTIDRLDAATKQKFMIKNNGNVGIGTNNPLARLTVLATGATFPGWYDSSYYTGIMMVNNNDYNVETSRVPAQHKGTLILSSDHAYDSGYNAAGSIGFSAKNEFGAYSVQYGQISGVRLGNFFGGLSFSTMHSDNTGTLKEAMRISNGNVGIGTANPTGVNGGNRLEGSSTTGFEYIATRDDTTTEAGDFVGAYLFKNTDTDGNAPHYAGMSSKATHVNGPMDLRFHTNRDKYEADEPAMIIDSAGNVGIGTASPGKKLEISAGYQSLGGYIHPYVVSGVVGGTIIGTRQGGGAYVDTLYITDSGSVGIGTNNPGAGFDAWVTTMRVSRAASSINFGTSIDFSLLNNANESFSYARISGAIADNTNGSEDGFISFQVGTNGQLGSSYEQDKMRITSSGNVGIGTTNPGAKLHVNGPEIRVTNVDTAVAKLSAYGVSQGTGLLYVGQSNDFGGGIEYNGDNNPVSTGAGADYTALYRLQASSFYWTARNYITGNQWEFRTTIINSDDRVKENEAYIRGATDTLMKLKPQLYDKKPSIKSTDTKEWFCEAGLIAQELYYDVPELRHLVKIPRDARNIDANVSITSTDPTEDPDYSAWGKDTSAVNYVGLVPYLIKAVQEITTELPRHKTHVSNITLQNVNDFVGLIVSKRGTVELSTKSEDKACYGVISEITCDTQNNEILVNSSGEGKIWVTNLTGNVEAGDLITTSNIAGYGQLQNSPVLSNFTVAKLTEDCDFNPSSTPVRRIRQEMSNVTVYSVSREVRVTEEEYNELAEEDRTTENRITYFDGDTQLTFDEYSNSESNTLRTETTLVFKLIHRHTSRTMREGYTPEVRQELVNVLDEHGQIQWEDTDETEKAYKIRYLDANGNITDEANHVYKAAFVGCTYHCG